MGINDDSSWFLQTAKVVLASRAEGFGMSEGSFMVWFMVWRAVYDDCPPPRSRGRIPIKDHQALSTVLAKLANSQVPNNINQLAKAANSGSLILTPDVEAALRQAAADIAVIRDLLVKALGLSDVS